MNFMHNFRIEMVRHSRSFHSCRIRNKKHGNFMNLRYKKSANDLALENFDQFYKPVYQNLWPSIRLGLLSQQKYCCFINNFGDIDKSVELMEEINAHDIRTRFNKRLTILQERLVNDISGTHDQELALEVELEIDDEARSTECPLLENAEGRFAPHTADKSVYFNQFVPATKLMGFEEYVNEGDYFQSTIKTFGKVKFETIKSDPKPLPANWKIFCFDRGDVNTFPAPAKGASGFLNYYLMDAASLLPVFALDPSPGDCILDMCSAPGGKALAILQTLYDVELVCVENQLGRAKRLRQVLCSYLSHSCVSKPPKIILNDGRNYDTQTDQFNKILVDAPCTTDRRSANEAENSIFKSSRMKERTLIPSVQTELLSAALKAVKVGGSVVYSTCSLSPIQNDNVVQQSMNMVSEETNAKFVIHDLSHLFFPFRFFMRLHPITKFGQLVIPFLPCNFGPMYISRIDKTSG
ncbi:hypothetical protein CHUAL_013239 [Chamberlinius hualienensis]